jgi:hypothetical protein
MKLRVRLEAYQIDEVFRGNTAEEVVSAMKARVLRDLPFAQRLFVGAMSNLQFAQEAVSLYNREQKKSVPRPSSCEEFLALAEQEGIAQKESA